ncbi:GUN4 domain-containing protein [Adonisia turfae]
MAKGYKIADKIGILVERGGVAIVQGDIDLGRKKLDVSQPIYTSEKITNLEQQLNRFPKLKQLLSEQQWKKADKETLAVMCAMRGKTISQNLSVDDIVGFPCEELQIIDWLWLKYSDWRFGFSVQNLIFEQVDYNQEKFATLIGWRQNSNWIAYADVNFSKSARVGHLPIGGQGGLVSFWSQITRDEGIPGYLNTAGEIFKSGVLDTLYPGGFERFKNRLNAEMLGEDGFSYLWMNARIKLMSRFRQCV